MAATIEKARTRKGDAKRSKWVENADGTATFKMSWLGREDEITRVFPTFESCIRVSELFTFFGIDSAKAGKPVQSDIDLLAVRKAAR